MKTICKKLFVKSFEHRNEPWSHCICNLTFNLFSRISEEVVVRNGLWDEEWFHSQNIYVNSLVHLPFFHFPGYFHDTSASSWLSRLTYFLIG